jgi:hypothetical protein
LDDVVEVVEDVGEAFVDGVSSAAEFAAELAEEALDAAVDGLTSIADAALWVGNAAVEAAADAASAFGDVATEFGEAFATGVSDAAGAVAGVAGDVLSTAIDTTLSALDDSGFFDVLEVATLTMLDVEYDSETGLSVDYGLEGVYGFGVRIGEGGVSADVDIGGVGAEAGYGPNGLVAGVSAGLDFGPLPNAELHVSIDDDGDLGIGGRAEAYLPSPAGFSGGEVAVDYQETDEGFRLDASATARHYAPTGTYAGAGVHTSYEEDAQGYHTNVGVHAELGQLGGPEVSTSIDYDEFRQGDVTGSGVSVSAAVSGAGMEAGGTISYAHVETGDGDEFDVFSGSAYASGAGVSASGQATVISGPDGVSVDGDLDVGLVDPASAVTQVADVSGVHVTDIIEVPDLPAAEALAVLDEFDAPDVVPPVVPDATAPAVDGIPDDAFAVDEPVPADVLPIDAFADEAVVGIVPSLPEMVPDTVVFVEDVVGTPVISPPVEAVPQPPVVPPVVDVEPTPSFEPQAAAPPAVEPAPEPEPIFVPEPSDAADAASAALDAAFGIVDDALDGG